MNETEGQSLPPRFADSARLTSRERSVLFLFSHKQDALVALPSATSAVAKRTILLTAQHHRRGYCSQLTTHGRPAAYMRVDEQADISARDGNK